MKLANVTLYQAIRLGNTLETYLDVENKKHKGLSIEFESGLIRVKADCMKRMRCIPTANVKEFEPFNDTELEQDSKQGRSKGLNTSIKNGL